MSSCSAIKPCGFGAFAAKCNLQTRFAQSHLFNWLQGARTTDNTGLCIVYTAPPAGL